jgi:hypothetical protein
MTNIQPQKPTMTLGQHLDSVLTAAGHDVTLAEADAETWGEKAWSWVKSEWHNLLTAASTAYMALKMSGKL